MKKVIPESAVLIPDLAELVFKGVIFDTYHWQQAMHDGSMATFEMLKRADTAKIIAVIDGKILILDDTQPHRGTKTDFPGGRIEPDELTILDGAKRELHEETGYTLKNWRLVTVAQPYFKMEWFIYTYIAWGESSKEAPHIDVGEKITLKLVDLATLKSLADFKVGYLGESQNLLAGVETVDDLVNLPEFKGTEVDR